MNNDLSIRKLVGAALFAALICVVTFAVAIPTPGGGYVNPGDAIILFSSWLLGPIWGAAAAGIGSSLADILAGYAVYAPGTFIIKGVMGLVAGLLMQHHRSNLKMVIAVSVLTECIMIGGYFLYESLLLGIGSGAFAAIPGNCIQGLFSVAAGSVLILTLSKTPYIRRMLQKSCK
ncbi:MAG: ECF transporter S component [Oscillospiraceae bacterium]|jgi:uncharacterized membrane protein